MYSGYVIIMHVTFLSPWEVALCLVLAVFDVFWEHLLHQMFDHCKSNSNLCILIMYDIVLYFFKRSA